MADVVASEPAVLEHERRGELLRDEHGARDACTDCENPDALMTLATTRITRQLTPSEKQTYLGG